MPEANMILFTLFISRCVNRPSLSIPYGNPQKESKICRILHQPFFACMSQPKDEIDNSGLGAVLPKEKGEAATEPSRSYERYVNERLKSPEYLYIVVGLRLKIREMKYRLHQIVRIPVFELRAFHTVHLVVH